MKKIFFISIITALFINAGYAQPGKLFNKIKNKVNQRVDKKTDEAIDKSLDKAEGKGGDTSTGGNTEETTAAAEPVSIKSYAKYDFVPGDSIIYTNHFEGENSGELPIGWNSSGSAVVVSLNTLTGNWLKLSQNSMVLTDNVNEFSENCTVEFDLVLQHQFNGAILPQLAFGVLASGDLATTDNELFRLYAKVYAAELKVQPGVQDDSHMHLQTYVNNGRYLNTEVKRFKQLQKMYGGIIHVAIQVQKERLRIWFNEEKLYDLPKAITADAKLNQVYFKVRPSSYSDAQVSYFISNFKIAKGLPDTRHKLVDEGKFSTTGILFDVNAATIKPESSGVLKEVADVLKKHADIKVKIVGHTDSDGADAANLELSKKRAIAVKEALAKEYGIDAARMEADGKGETEPAGDNKTKEGKVQNRRVEFIKQ